MNDLFSDKKALQIINSDLNAVTLRFNQQAKADKAQGPL